MQHEVRPRRSQANPNLRHARARQRRSGLRRAARAKEVLQPNLSGRRREVVLVGIVVVVQRRLSPVSTSRVQQSDAEKRRTLLHRKRHRQSKLHWWILQMYVFELNELIDIQ
jgi:hypothetical protein